ncbi:phage tail spike protein, partial [Streptococcus pneumoniae]|uniref:phage tail spike protein n=1 Tax=Streptococcus pneumoniae TaxID=1313 RepID=UPI00067E457F
MIYLTEGNTPLNEAYNDEIVHLGNNTYQLTFRFPTSDTKWELLKEETFLTADDLHGEQDFYIFEVEKQQGYIQVYANQVISLLNNYIVSSIEVDRVSGTRVLSAFAGSITRANPFSFFSDIDDRHTLNIKDKNAMEVLAKGKHSILGQWGGDMVRNGYNLRLLKNGGSENESLFMYKKNLSSYQHKTSTKSLKTRITFKTTVKGEGENAVDHDYMVVIDSPLLGNYSQIYEDVVEVNDQDVTDEASLIEYGKQYFRTSMCDMLEDNLEISVVGQSDVAVQMFDVVSFYHEWYGLDVRKKITKYTYSPMAKLLKSIGFGTFQSSLANAIGGIVNDAVLNESRNLHQIFEERLKKEIANADRAFDAEFSKREKTITDAIELAKAKAEEVKQELSDTINQRFNSFDNGPLKEAKRKAEEALRNAGASSSLAQESKRIGLDSVARLEAFKSQTTSAQTALSGDLDALKRTIANDIRPKQAQAEAEIAKQVEALSRTKNELDGASTLLAQEAKRIELDSVARLEAFKSQTTSAQTALSGDLDVLKRTIANDIRPKQAQAEAEIAKQVEALSRTKNELSGVKSAQATYEETTTRRLSELTNLANGKASKSELTQTAEELSSKIASVQVGGRNYIRGTKRMMLARGLWASGTFRPSGAGTAKTIDVSDSPVTGFDKAIRLTSSNARDQIGIAQDGFYISQGTYTMSCWVKGRRGQKVKLQTYWQVNDNSGISPIFTLKDENWTKLSFTSARNRAGVASIGYVYLVNAEVGEYLDVLAPQLEDGSLATSSKEAPEDIEGQISTVESTFKQRANSLEAGVNRLTEGLRTKADISSLNVTAENIRQSVKSLETDTQNKLNQKLSQAEFEVRAGSIRQEILNATKDKADKTLVVSEAGKLREEFSKMKVGGRNLWIKSKTVGAVIEKLPENHVTGQKECYRLENNSTLTFNLEPDFSSRLYQKVTFSAWIKYENVVQGRNFWNVFNCFKHYLFRKNSETGVQSGPDYATLGMYKGSADWKYITFTYDYSEKTNFDQLKTSLRFNLEGATSGTAWVTGIKVEIGSVATDWSPAPEDADGLITEAKATFERTAQGLRTDLSAIQEYVNKDGQRQEALQRYTREESTRQATAVRELVNRDFVGKATYQEDVKGINQRIEAVKTSANKDIASQIASYRQSVDGKFTDISSQITTYKQDVGGQISGLSNRLTSSEQGTTTQISNLSNRINSNKQGTDNQISNLKTQVATNKDNAERQMGRISDQVSANKANADSQFANVTNQLARKVETTDFQRVKETSKLYERILGNTENGIADKVARMALTNQLFQVEVAKNASNGQNLLKGTKDFSGGWKNKGANWKKHAEKYKGVDVLFKNNSWNGVGQEIDAKIGEVYTFSLWMKSDWKNDTVNFYVNRNGSVEKGWGVPSETSVAITSEWKRYSFTFKITVDGFIFPRVERLNQNTNLYIAGLKLEKGSYATPYTEAPEDTDEAIRSVQSQLTGSWAVQNINSAGDIISGINLGANGHNRFVGKLTHITGETLIDRAVIKSAMVDKLKTANFEAGSVTTTILDAEAVTAEKLKVDNALIRKLTANDAFIDQLISKRIFSTKVESVISSSTFLEAYQGRIGGFTLGQFDQG